NPPKKYEDIYPLNFDNDPEGIYAEIRRVVQVWIDHGVTAFRVDNPHTKPLSFWERLLADVHAPGHDAHAGQDRVPPVVHVLHVAQHQARARGVPGAGRGRRGAVAAAQ